MIIILLIVAILIVFLIYNRKVFTYENFGDQFQPPCQHSRTSPNAINQLRSNEIRKNVRLNKYNRIDERTIKAPNPRIGETECHKVTCPNWIDETAVCWVCQ